MMVIAFQFLGQVIDDVILEEIRTVGEEELRAAIRLRSTILKEKISKEILDSLLNILVESETQSIANAVALDALHAR